MKNRHLKPVCNSIRGWVRSERHSPLTGDDKWWRFDIQLSNLSAKDCKYDSIYIADAAGVIVRGVKAENKRIRLIHVRDCTLDGVDLKDGEFIVEGQPAAATTQPARESGAPQIPSTRDMRDAPKMDVVIRNIHIDQGYLDLHDCRGLTCTDVRITHPVSNALRINHLIDSSIEKIAVE